MPKNKDLKRRVRSRMSKTGESYTAARSTIVRKKTPSSTARKAGPARTAAADFAQIAGMSDKAVQAKTGKNWKQWVRVLDALEATAMSHKEIAAHLHGEMGVSSWWAQMVTVGYERIRGLRDKGQRRGGGYDVNKSKTLPVPIATLYGAFAARQRTAWLPDTPLTVKKATREKSMRITWHDGTPVEVYFWEKGPGKSQVQLQHRELRSKAEADKVRAFWTERLAALAEVLRP